MMQDLKYLKVIAKIKKRAFFIYTYKKSRTPEVGIKNILSNNVGYS